MIRHVESLLAGKERDSGNGSLSEDKPLKRSLPSYVSPETSKALQDFAKRVDIDGWCNEWMDYYEEPLTLRQFIKKKLEALKKEFGI